MDFKQKMRVPENKNTKAGGDGDNEGAGKVHKKDEQVSNQTETTLLLQMVPQLKNSFTLKKKIGEGAFSCVYLAVAKSTQTVLRDQVALKHLIPTSHPNRMLVELQCLQKLGGRCNVMSILTCIRNGSHVVLVMPYFPHDPFSSCVGKLDLNEIREYMRNLLLALQEVHANGIIHRDVKPSNFLYNRYQQRYALCDFGLAQFSSKCDNIPDANDLVKENLFDEPTDFCANNIPQAVIDSRIIEPKLGPAFFKLLPPTSGSSSHVTSNLQLSVFGSKSSSSMPNTPSQHSSDNVCCCHNLPQVCSMCLNRPVQIAPRAGTPGYRPPEVLLKHPFQTTAIDVWSAGIILLCFLSGHISFFHSNDDLASLAEIVALFGTLPMKECARQLGKVLICRPEMPPLSLAVVCDNLRSNLKQPNPINGKELSCAYDLLKQMLTLNPNLRMSATQALSHPFFM